MSSTTTMHIRWVNCRDLPEMLAIESLLDSPWTEEDFLKHLRQRNCIGMVVEQDDYVVGYMVYELWKTHFVVLRMAVAWIMRRSGIGAAMIDKLKSKMDSRKRSRFVVDVPEDMLGFQLFLKACGLYAECIIDDCYRFVWRHQVCDESDE